MISKKIFFLASLSLVLTNCQKKPDSYARKAIQKEEIKSIEWSTFGGQMGYVEKLVITKDSIHHKYFTAMKNNETIEHHFKNSPESWQNLSSAVNLNDFRKIKNGNSNQPVDGTDEQITIRSKNSQDSIINGDSDHKHYSKIKNFTKLLNDLRENYK